MKPRKKRSDKQWCAPEHCKRDCSWKGEKLAASNYGGKVRRKGKDTSKDIPCDCVTCLEDAVVIETETHRTKRYYKNGIIMEVRY